MNPHRAIRLVMLLAFFLVAGPVAYAEMPPLPPGKGEYCVAPTEVMRKDHMQFLLHQRDRTVIDGIRTKKHSLVECIDCHVQTNPQGEFIPVDAPGQFCAVCHTFVSAKLDCFECHATTPDAPHATDSAMHEIESDQRQHRSGLLIDEIRQHLSITRSRATP